MSPTPTGRLVGTDLVLTRTFRAPVADVWASLTESDRTARWFGPWQGQAGPGRPIKIQMVHEEGKPWMDMTIDECAPPHRLALSSDSWHLDMVLTPVGDTTELRFTQHLDDTESVGEIGPGWEYYLDGLVATRDNLPFPDFADYYPAMKDHFESQR